MFLCVFVCFFVLFLRAVISAVSVYRQSIDDHKNAPRLTPAMQASGRLCDVSVTGAFGRIDDSVTAGGLRGGARCMQPSIAGVNTRQRRPIIMKYIPRVFVKQLETRQEMQKCSE